MLTELEYNFDLTPPWHSYLADVEPMEQAAEQAAHAPAGPEWTLHSEQLRLLQSTHRYKVLVAGRRWGKSETGSRWMVQGAWDDHLRGEPGVSWVILPTYTMARPLWRKFMSVTPPEWLGRVVGTDTRPDYFEIGTSRIEFHSGDRPERLVGEGLKRVYIDEAGIIKPLVWTESVMPALLDFAAPALLTGTPKGRNWFRDMYLRGLDPEDTQVGAFGGSTYQNPYIKPSEIDALERVMLPRLFRQEILAEFLSEEGAVFRGHRLCAADELSREPTAVYGVDLARTTDYTVIVGFDRIGRMTYFDRFHKVSWPMQKDRIARLDDGRKPLFVVDATGVGDPIVMDLQARGLRIRGYTITGNNKAPLIEHLALKIENRELVLLNEPLLLNELDIFEFKTTGTGRVQYSAPDGRHDDIVMALALGAEGLKTAGSSIAVGELEKPTRKFEEVSAEPNPDYEADSERWS